MRTIGELAVAVDPCTAQRYVAGDDGCPPDALCRWTGPPADAVLEALAALDGGWHVPDLAVTTRIGTVFMVDWVPVPCPGLRVSARRATRCRGARGVRWADGGAWFVTSPAEREDDGARQAWFLDPRRCTVELRALSGHGD